MQFLKEYKIDFLNFVNQEDAKIALLLNLIEPRCGGVLLAGKKGTGKSTLLKAFSNLVRSLNIPIFEVPMNTTEEAVLGGIDIEETIKTGRRILQRGILSRANRGFLIMEDINLFPHDILSIIFEVQARGENIIEREGITLKELANFQILATMNPEEAELSPHFLDRFGLCAIIEEIRDKEKRKEIVKLNISDNSHSLEESQLIKKIQNCRDFIKKIKVSDKIKEFISELVLKEAVSGHRADIYLYYASMAYSAYLEEDSITEEHVQAVAPLVLNHRRRIVEPENEEQEHDHEPETSNSSEKEESKEKKEQKAPVLKTEESHERKSQNIPSSEKEEVFSIGEDYRIKRFIFKRDRIIRNSTGRRTKTKIKGRGGRYIRSLIQKRPNIAIDATLRAAAPFQRVRGRKGSLVIFDEDLRYKEKERKMGHLVIFVLDGSGSMGVQNRMIETKGAIKSLLIDCYQKRDKVSLIVFRKNCAEVVLPPTSSVEFASKKLKEIPTGGKTPLGAGLLEAYKLIKNISLKEKETRYILILVTDGRANQSFTNLKIEEEIERISNLLKDLSFVDIIVIDTEDKGKFLTTDYAKKLAVSLEADYYTMAGLKTDDLIEIINVKKTTFK